MSGIHVKVACWGTRSSERGTGSHRIIFLLSKLIILDTFQLLLGSVDDWMKSEFQKKNLGILGNGLVNSNGTFWARQRRMMNPAFSHRNVKVHWMFFLYVWLTIERDSPRLWSAKW